MTSPWTAAGASGTVLAVVGPTGSGKSALALELAERLGAEVINADAFQVYRGMDIGTAKLPAEARRGVRHHLIDVADISEDFGVARYQRLGREALRSIAGRGRPAIIVGGSGLYVRGLLDDLRLPGTDPAVRARWQVELQQIGAPALHSVLGERDPSAAAAILPSNGRRIVRALEVIEITGRPFQATLPKAGPPLVPHVSVGLEPDLASLDASLASRARDMMADGFLEEVASLASQGMTPDLPAARAIGYPQLLDHLAGRTSLQEAVELTIRATRKYARRQLRWFRADPRVQWYPPRISTADAILDSLAVLGA